MLHKWTRVSIYGRVGNAHVMHKHCSCICGQGTLDSYINQPKTLTPPAQAEYSFRHRKNLLQRFTVSLCELTSILLTITQIPSKWQVVLQRHYVPQIGLRKLKRIWTSTRQQISGRKKNKNACHFAESAAPIMNLLSWDPFQGLFVHGKKLLPMFCCCCVGDMAHLENLQWHNCFLKSGLKFMYACSSYPTHHWASPVARVVLASAHLPLNSHTKNKSYVKNSLFVPALSKHLYSAAMAIGAG